jgi:four helix bundle protein
MNAERKDILKEKSFHFAIRVANLCLFLSNEKKEFVLSKQLLRSGTAIGALIRESKNAESKADFIHKLGIAQKECDETIYWLELLAGIKLLNKTEFDSISADAIALLKIIRSSIITAKKNLYS